MKTFFSISARAAAILVLAAGIAGAADALAPKAVCPEPEYDFGERDNSGTVEHDYVIRNEGQLSLQITSVKASCGCTAVRSSQDVIAPGQEGTIHASFDLKGRVGDQLKTITVSCNDPQSPTLLLQLRGKAVQPVRAAPSSVFFGRVGAGSVRSRTFDVVSSKGRIIVLEARADTPLLSLEQMEENPDPSVKTFRISLADDAPAGNLQGSVILNVLADDIPKTLVVPVQAFVAPEAAPDDGEP
jgi:hypothetical protein